MATDAKTTGTDEGQDILVTLSQINKGKAVTEANAKFTQLVDAVLQYGKGGKIVLTVAVNPARDEGGIEVEAAVDVKAPQPKHPAYFFVDGRRRNRLTRDDPSMEPMFGRSEAGGDD